MPACINPAHLFLGTHFDNMADMEKKGRARHPRGERHGRALLTEADVIAIRAARATRTATISSLAAKYGVSEPTISAVALRYNWKWL